jgi:O-antigen biosynthesis protein WbqP
MELRVKLGIDKMKPGITGWAQINGRDAISIEEKVAYEQEYLEKKSILFDIYIIIKTFGSVFIGKNVRH